MNQEVNFLLSLTNNGISFGYSWNTKKDIAEISFKLNENDKVQIMKIQPLSFEKWNMIQNILSPTTDMDMVLKMKKDFL